MTDLADHYAELGDLYETLGRIGEWYCPGNRDFYGWYRTRTGRGSWDGEGRAWALGREFPGICEDLERVVYATVNYAPARWFAYAWHPFDHGENGRKWKAGQSPTPGYGDLHAYAPFADIDLADGVKQDRPDGEIPREKIEAALRLYFEAFADLAGDRRHVFALDSVGGAYAFVAPTATAPIAEAFDREDRRVIFEDLTGRVNEWLQGVKTDVNERIGVGGTFEADLVNNKNRLYKVPLSVHSSLDGVVTPIDAASPEYRYTPLEAVDADAIASAETWAERFTGDHREAVSSVVATLWPDHYAEAAGWRDALAARVDEIKSKRERRERERASQPSIDELPEDLEYTDDIDVLKAKIENLDVEQVVREFCADFDTAENRDLPRFEPGYRHSETGESCFVNKHEGKIVDLNGPLPAMGPLTYVARERVSGFRPRDCHPEGSDWWQAVNELRKGGFDIPYFTGADGLHPDGLGLYEEPQDAEDARRKVLRAAAAADRE